jgi:cell division transport system permease protein
MLDSISFLRIFKTGFINFWRNLWLSAAATMVMVITLVIFSVLFVLFALTTYSINTVQNTVDISVYFKIGLAETQAKLIQEELLQDPNISQVTYRSPQQVKEEFRQKHVNDDQIMQAFNVLDENPFPATLNVKAVDLSYYPVISERLNSDQYKNFIDKVNFEDNRSVINRLGTILRVIVTGGIVLIVIFSLIAILVIYNTITLTIYNRKEEVEIMRLVGATNSYIRGPFLVESFMYSLFATIITSALFWPIFHKLLPKMALFLNPQINVLNVNIFNFWYLLGILLIVSLLLAVTSTMMAIRKYLRI